MKIAVYGSASGEYPDNIEKARELGRTIARRGHVLITGACTGLPDEAKFGANEVGGEVLGFSPGVDLNDHIQKFGFPAQGFTELRFIPRNFPYLENKVACLNLRNVYSAAECDAIAIIEGGIGTLGEFVNFYKTGKPIGVLEGTGGIADYVDQIVAKLKKQTKSPIIYYGNPEQLVIRLEGLVQALA